VAAHSADAATALLPLDAELRIVGPEGERTVPIADFFTSDGVWNRRMDPGEILVSIHVPRPASGSRHSFQKLRARDSIDFPMLNLAVRVDYSGDVVEDVRMAASALGSYPRNLGKLTAIVEGGELTDAVVEELAQQAFRQCHPLGNIPVDAEWRRAMVPVLVRRALSEIRG
jgi:4-hydroxybenzoyl-CoA reductase subunit beta